jgi:nucleotide-binding universal stress UspA family protein
MYKRILVPTDGSDTSEAGLREACKLAQAQGDTQIRVVHVVDELLTVMPELYGTAYDAVTEAVRRSGASLLAHSEIVAREYGLQAETQLIEAMGGVAGELVIKAAREWPADIIVCGTHGRRGLRRIVMGSDAEYIVRHTPVPILLIRKDGR